MLFECRVTSDAYCTKSCVILCEFSKNRQKYDGAKKDNTNAWITKRLGIPLDNSFVCDGFVIHFERLMSLDDAVFVVLLEEQPLRQEIAN